MSIVSGVASSTANQYVQLVKQNQQPSQANQPVPAAAPATGSGQDSDGDHDSSGKVGNTINTYA